MTSQYNGQTLDSYFGPQQQSPIGAASDPVLAAIQGMGQQMQAVAGAVATLQSEMQQLRSQGLPISKDMQSRLDTVVEQFESLQEQEEERRLATMTQDEVIEYWKAKAEGGSSSSSSSGGGQQQNDQDLAAGVHTQGPLKDLAEDEYSRTVLPQLLAYAQEQGISLSVAHLAALDTRDVRADDNGAIQWGPWITQWAFPSIRQWGDEARQADEPSPARQQAGVLQAMTGRPAAPGGRGEPDFFKSSQDDLIAYAQSTRRR